MATVPRFWASCQMHICATDPSVKRSSPQVLGEVVEMLSHSSNPQIDTIVEIIREWAGDNGMMI